MALLDNPFTRTVFYYGFAFGVGIPLLLSLLPAIPMAEGVQNAFLWVFNTIWQWNFLLPVDEIMYCVQIYFLFEFVAFSIKTLYAGMRFIKMTSH